MNDPLNSDTAIELLKTLAEADQSSDVERLGLPSCSNSRSAIRSFLPAQLQLAQCLRGVECGVLIKPLPSPATPQIASHPARTPVATFRSVYPAPLLADGWK